MMGTGGVALSGLVLMLAAPKTAHAVVAAAVQVVGIASVSAIDEPGRAPYQSQATNLSCLNTINCVYTFAPIPANHRLVISQVTGFLASLAAAPNAQVMVSGAHTIALFQVFTNEFIGPVTGYVDAGVSPTVQITLPATDQSASGFGTALLVGHLLDCSVSSCAAMVIQ